MLAPSLFSRRVTVMGLGRHGGGVAVARWLAEQGAVVTVTDLAPAETLSALLAALAAAPIAKYRLGEHHADDFERAEMVVVNPAARPAHPLVAQAAARGATITSEIELFLERCPATVVGVTGSNGKSTTATMLAQILRAGGRRAWLGGNIGVSLLDRLPHDRPASRRQSPSLAPAAECADVDAAAQPAGDIQAGDVVALELSSFQLAHLSPAARMPRWAIVTNCTPNHLDWHGDFAAYSAAKQRLVRGVGAEGAVMLGPELASSDSWPAIVPGRRLAAPAWSDEIATLVAGQHDRANAASAAAIALELGCERDAALAVLARFRPLPHRLRLIAMINGRAFYNDSKATSPAAALAAIAAIKQPIWWLGGGHAKGADFGELAQTVVRRTRGAAVFGASRGALGEALRAAEGAFPLAIVERLEAALDWCWLKSAPGDAILLSPAAASYDQYADYADRGRAFMQLVERLAASASRSAS